MSNEIKPLVLCACGQPAAYVTHDERPLCDRCNPGLCAPHPQAVRLPYPDWLVARRRERLAALQAGADLGDGPGLDSYDLNNLRWLNTLDVRNQEIARLEHARALDVVAERALREERDALRAAVRAERLAAAEYAVAIDGGTDQEVARAWKRDTDAKRALLALLPPEAP